MYCFVGVWTLAGATAEDCATGNAAVTSCMTPVRNLQGHISLSVYTKEELERHCSAVTRAADCLKAASCEEADSAHLKEHWQGVEAGFHYLCGAGKEEYLKEEDCWKSSNFQREMLECERTNKMESDELKKSGTVDHVKECKIDNDWVDCINDAVEANTACDEAASEVAKFFAIRSMEPVAEVHGCHLDEADDGDTDEHLDDATSCAQLSAALLASSLLLVSLSRTPPHPLPLYPSFFIGGVAMIFTQCGGAGRIGSASFEKRRRFYNITIFFYFMTLSRGINEFSKEFFFLARNCI
jgi:hypothetical protein